MSNHPAVEYHMHDRNCVRDNSIECGTPDLLISERNMYAVDGEDIVMSKTRAVSRAARTLGTRPASQKIVEFFDKIHDIGYATIMNINDIEVWRRVREDGHRITRVDVDMGSGFNVPAPGTGVMAFLEANNLYQKHGIDKDEVVSATMDIDPVSGMWKINVFMIRSINKVQMTIIVNDS